MISEYAGLHAHLTKEFQSPINLYFRYGFGGTICRDWLATDQPAAAKIVVLVLNERYASHEDLWPKLRD